MQKCKKMVEIYFTFHLITVLNSVRGLLSLEHQSCSPVKSERKKGMRILHIIYDDVGNTWLGGGGAAGTRNIARYALQYGHSMHILTAEYPGAREQSPAAGIRISHVGVGRFGYLVSRITFGIAALLYLIRYAKEYDLVVDDMSPFSPTLSFLVKRKIPIIANFQNVFGKHFYRKFPIVAPVLHLLEYINLHAYDYYIVVSPFMKEYIGDSRKVHVAPNGLFRDEFPDVLGEKKEMYLAVYGRIEIYQKGLDILCDTLHLLAGYLRERGIVVRVAGSGKDEASFRELVQKKKLGEIVEFSGKLSGDERFGFLARSLLLFAPSRFEAMPRAIVEALACGTAVVCPKTPPFEFIVQSQDIGILVDNPTPREYADVMRELLSDVPRLETMGQAACGYSKKFDEEKFMQDRLGFYTDVAGES